MVNIDIQKKTDRRRLFHARYSRHDEKDFVYEEVFVNTVFSGGFLFVAYVTFSVFFISADSYYY